MFEKFKDNILLTDIETNNKLLFNQRSFYSLIYGIMTHYLRFNSDFAVEKIEKWNDGELTYNNVALLGHELEYDLAMLIAYGHDYSNKGYNPEPPNDYFNWCESYEIQHDLKSSIIEYLE